MPFFEQLLRAAASDGSRSTALAPLQLPFGLLLASAVWSAIQGAPVWLTIALASGAGLCLLFLLGAFSYFVRKNPDALRSERYSLRKLEIRRGLIGDSHHGLVGD